VKCTRQEHSRRSIWPAERHPERPTPLLKLSENVWGTGKPADEDDLHRCDQNTRGVQTVKREQATFAWLPLLRYASDRPCFTCSSESAKNEAILSLYALVSAIAAGIVERRTQEGAVCHA
jgi:hypothetical protein